MKKFLFFIAIPFIFAASYSVAQNVAPDEKLVASPGATIDEPVKPAEAPEVALNISPAEVLQGDPALITIDGVETTAGVKSLAFNGQVLPVFLRDGKLSALLGIDLKLKENTYPLVLTLADGRTVKKDFVVQKRTIINAPFTIPEKLGGNTPESSVELINTLNEETAIISNIKSGDKALWDGPFGFPLEGNVEVTDKYGYSRHTGYSTLSHKGTDFRAEIGTPVVAINSGKISFVGFFRNYGNTIVVDHGLGLQSFYLHLSQVGAHVGDEVAKGDVIGLSGDTGYVLAPHLHLSIKIDGISIDAEKFLDLLGN